MVTQSGLGFSQYQLWDVFNLLRTNLLGVTAKLDADAGVTDTNYTSLNTFTWDRKFARVAIRDQAHWLAAMDKLVTAFNAVLTKLDADAGVTDTNYNATDAMPVYTNNRATADLLKAGMHDGALVKWVSLYVSAFNATLTKLDADGGVTDTNYGATWALPSTGTTALVNASRARLRIR